MGAVVKNVAQMGAAAGTGEFYALHAHGWVFAEDHVVFVDRIPEPAVLTANVTDVAAAECSGTRSGTR